MINLHNHSEYSLLDGLIRAKQMVSRAKELGQSAIALTDHGNLHGAIKFYKECLKQEIKPILGCEMYVAKDRTCRIKQASRKKNLDDLSPAEEEIDNENYHLLLFAKDYEGWCNLTKIVSNANLEGFYYKPRTDFSYLKENCKGIIASSACLAGEISQELLKGNLLKAQEIALAYQEIFDEFYLELIASDSPEQIQANQLIAELAKQTGIPLIVTNDVHFLQKSNYYHHEILLAIQTKTTYSNPERFKLDSDCYYLKSAEDTFNYLKLSFPDNPLLIHEAIENTHRIADACNVELPLGQVLYPAVDLPETETTESWLRKQAYEGLDRLTKEYNWDYQKYKDRLDYEIDILLEAGLAAYFLLMQDICNFATQKEIPQGPGRGSAGGTLLARVLEITKIDPIEHNLSFERFWFKGKKSIPDIDTDWCPNRRGELYQYLISKYGADHCCLIGTFGTLATRSIIRDVCRVLEVPLEIADRIAKAVPEKIADEESGEAVKVDILSALEESAELRDWQTLYPGVFEIAENLEGLPRQTSTHAAGIIIAPTPLFGFVPLLSNKNDDNPVPVIQWDMGDVEEYGLIKLDLLGLDAMTQINECLELIKKSTGTTIDLLKIDLEDKRVYENINKGKVFGVFQIQTNTGRQMVNAVKPTKFSELGDILALGRPGPMQAGLDKIYCDVKSQRAQETYLHEDLKVLLKPTYGAFVYQEQTIAITKIIAGFDDLQGDKFRKGMAKKHPEILAELRQKFLDGAKDLGKVSEDQAVELWDNLEKFSGYGFNQAHSSAYALITYWQAWLRTHYPLEFFASTLTNIYASNKPNREELILKAVFECRNENIIISPPNINESREKAFIFCGKIRFPLCGIKGLGDVALNCILEHAPFASFSDFLERAPSKINKKVIQILILAGAFDWWESNRVKLFREYFEIKNPPKQPRKKKGETEEPEVIITPFEPEFKIDKENTITILEIEDYGLEQKLEWERLLLGAYISGHPLDSLEIPSWREAKHGDKVEIAGKIANNRKVKIKTGKSAGKEACFITVDTRDGELTLILWPEKYEQYTEFVSKGNVIKAKGKLEKKGNEWQVIGSEVAMLEKGKRKTKKKKNSKKESAKDGEKSE